MTSKRVTIIVKPSLTAETDAPMTQTLTKQQLLSAFRHKEGKVRAYSQKNHSNRAAVLVPIIEYTNNFRVLFTQKPDFLQHHAGQISFPGGREEPSDASLIETAMREAYEEIGLTASQITLLGSLPTRETFSGPGFLVQPYVALIEPPLRLMLDPNEVAAAFEVPLNFLVDQQNWQHRHGLWQGKRRYYYAIQYEDYFIWGLTAAIIVSLGELLKEVTKK